MIRLALLGWMLALVLALTQWPSGTAAQATPTEAEHPAIVICEVFGERYCLDALTVAWCESRFLTSAQNGQYLGLFQMGTHERHRFGDGAGSWAQARAARRYFVASGRDWSPWQCKP